jgi:hypothetical protein
MVDEGDANFNELLRKALILKTQKNQDVFWNRYLSWFYVQQKEFDKALFKKSHLQTQSRIVDHRKFGTTGSKTEMRKLPRKFWALSCKTRKI